MNNEFFEKNYGKCEKTCHNRNQIIILKKQTLMNKPVYLGLSILELV